MKQGFQIGGYYTHMWFEQDGDCLTWHIEGDGMFPTPGRTIEFHICDFRQIEKFVKLWGRELRKRGWIAEATPAEKCTAEKLMSSIQTIDDVRQWLKENPHSRTRIADSWPCMLANNDFFGPDFYTVGDFLEEIKTQAPEE